MRTICAKATLLAIFLTVVNYAILAPVAMAARFIDLSGNWSEKYVNGLSDKGMISAEANGKFRPDEPVTRAVMAAWLVKVLGIENQPVSNKPSFPDVKPSDWYYKPVEIIRQNNYISGYADGFRPNQFIQRGEVISIIARTLSLPTPDDSTVTELLGKFKDGSKVPDWARVGVAEAAQANILCNHPTDDVVAATTIASRGDTAALLFKLNEYQTRQQISQATSQASSAAVTTRPADSTPATGQAAYNPNAAGAPEIAPGGYSAQTQPYQQQPNYQGQVQQSGVPPGAYPQGGYSGQAGFGHAPQQSGYGQGSAPAGGYPQYPQSGGYAPQGGLLQGHVAVVPAGTHFEAALKNTLDSGSTQPGEEVQAALGSPIYSGGVEVVPAGSRLVGQVTNVVSAKRFRFGANGKIDIRFTSIETPDGRRFPLSASVDSTQLRLTGGTTKGRIGKGLLVTGIGAGGGAALGTGLGAIVGATSHGQVGRATGMGAVFGTAIGAGVGGVGAMVRKGSEVKIIAGTALPVQLDESLQISAGGPPPVQQPFGFQQQPVQQPSGGYYPQN